MCASEFQAWVSWALRVTLPSSRLNAKPLVSFEVLKFANFGSCVEHENGSDFSDFRLDSRTKVCTPQEVLI